MLRFFTVVCTDKNWILSPALVFDRPDLQNKKQIEKSFVEKQTQTKSIVKSTKRHRKQRNKHKNMQICPGNYK